MSIKKYIPKMMGSPISTFFSEVYMQINESLNNHNSDVLMKLSFYPMSQLYKCKFELSILWERILI